MNKRVKIILLALVMGMNVFAFLCSPRGAYSLDGSFQTPYNGHLCAVQRAGRPVCGNCHISHGSTGKRTLIYRNTQTAANKSGIKEFCAGCHYRGNPEFPGISSGLLMGSAQWNGGQNADKNNINGNVFLGGAANHVMGESVTGRLSTGKAEVPGVFPLDETEGFCCITCHDPHYQPNGNVSGHGDYLRVKDSTVSAGETHNRNSFCRQCHPKYGTVARVHPWGETTDPQCEDCHRPHDGYLYPDDPSRESEIFIHPLPEVGIYGFASAPSISPLRRERGGQSVYYREGEHECFNDDMGSKPCLDGACYYISTKCKECHISDDHPDAPQLSANRGHHPMDQPWAGTSCAVCHQSLPSGLSSLLVLDGFREDGTPLPPDRQVFTCIGCHTDHNADYSPDHSIAYSAAYNADASFAQLNSPITVELAVAGAAEGNPSQLRYASFKNDDTAFCEYCHNSPEHTKSRFLLEANGGKHYKTRNDLQNPIERTFKATTVRPEKKVKCGGCMFCHFIHPNDKDDPRDTTLISCQRADLKALMRVPARELDWGTQGEDIIRRPDPLDRYEALCYGCHGDPSIVGSYGKYGSLLYPACFFSHRFACKPSSANTISNTVSNTAGQTGFPLADGTPGAGPPGPPWAYARDDYGTVKGQIYCGTCHDVHINTKLPYLYRLSADDTASPYEPDGFCEQCHCSNGNPDPLGGGSTHPLGYEVVPNPAVTGDAFPSVFAGGGSGSDHGITAGGNTTNGGIVCLTCHNVHAASTSWNGTVPGDAQLPPGNRGNHGQLLVMDNSAGQTGSNLCLACHEQYGNQPVQLALPTYYLDNDGDGYGDIGNSRHILSPEGKYTALEAGDLDDTDPMIYPWAPPAPAQCSGDINQDGQVTPADAFLVFQCYLGIKSCSSDCVDVNKDGLISPADALCVFRHYLGSSGCLD